ncbi:MAG: YqaJ viral recombinase family protein [Clostridia bacterium]|nr:YqaJ viral recombinase family protein [Clostridia bacterium]
MVIANTAKISHDEWLNLRRTFIGGSDAAAVVGLNPYTSKYSLFWDKVGALPPKEDTEPMRLGRDLEEYVARRFMEKTGKKIRRDRKMYVIDEYPFIGADIDRRIVGENAILECKTTSARTKCNFESGEIPLHWYCQCLHYMNVVKADRCYLAVLVMGVGFYVFTIEEDVDEQAKLLSKEIDFWQEHVLKGIPPATDGSEATVEALKNVYSKGDGTETVSLSDMEDLLAERAMAKATIDDMSRRVDAIESEIKARLGDNVRGESDGYVVTWKRTTRRPVDSAKLAQIAPDIYKEVTKESYSRTFRVIKKEA